MRTVPGHKIRCFGIAIDGTLIPRNPGMKNKDWDWDATCSCGWDSRIGGATMSALNDAIAAHKADAAGSPAATVAAELGMDAKATANFVDAAAASAALAPEQPSTADLEVAAAMNAVILDEGPEPGLVALETKKQKLARQARERRAAKKASA